MKYPSLNKAYRLWLLGAFGMLGLHRRYLRKHRTATLWLCTGGFFGIGALLDLFLLPWLVQRMHLLEQIQQLEAEIAQTELLREELAHKQKYEEAAYQRDKEKVLRRKVAELRRQLSLRR
ncbi:MAG: TM2 domain-containing protein [Chitinophagaceae bacterium]|nr:MAG: TM2 domain-containing protein [Chitinophagaceae bacterium]